MVKAVKAGELGGSKGNPKKPLYLSNLNSFA